MLIQEEEYFEMLIKVYYLYILNIANYAVVQNIYLFIYLLNFAKKQQLKHQQINKNTTGQTSTSRQLDNKHGQKMAGTPQQCKPITVGP